MDRFIIFIGVIVVIATGWAIGFGIFAGLTWVICWSFDLEFTWKYALGVWVVYLFLSGLFKTNVTIEQESNFVKHKREYDMWRK